MKHTVICPDCQKEINRRINNYFRIDSNEKITELIDCPECHSISEIPNEEGVNLILINSSYKE